MNKARMFLLCLSIAAVVGAIGAYLYFDSQTKSLSPDEILRVGNRFFALEAIARTNGKRFTKIEELKAGIIEDQEGLSPETVKLGEEAITSLQNLKDTLKKVDGFVNLFPDTDPKTLEKRAAEIDALADETIMRGELAEIAWGKFFVAEHAERKELKTKPTS